MRLNSRIWLDGSCSLWRDKISSNSKTERSKFQPDCTNRSGLEVEFQLKKVLSCIGLSTVLISHKLPLQLTNLLLGKVFKSFTPGAMLEKNFAQASEPASDAGEVMPQPSLSPAEAWRRSQEPRPPGTSLDPTAPEWWSKETKEYFRLQELKKAKRKPRGYHGITNEGKRMVRCTATLLERIAAGRKVGFLTTTLPSMSRELLDKCTEKWAEICRQFNQELTRELKRNKLPPYYVYVSEWQKRKALHMHCVYIASNRKGNVCGPQYPLQADWFRALWKRVLKNVIGIEFNTESSIDVGPVRESVAGYLSKYVTKGNNHKKDVTQTCTQSDTDNLQPCTQLNTFDSNLPSMQICTQLDTKTCRHATQPCTQPDTETDTCKHPSAWWGASTKLKKKVESLIVNIEIEVKKSQKRCFDNVSDYWINHALDIISKLDCYWQQIITVGNGITMAVTGRMKPIENYIEKFKEAVIGEGLMQKERERIASKEYYEDYWKWRYKRDRCNPSSDKKAIEEWICEKFNISYGI
ncbi:MAG: hypothetical protein I4N51_04725 [Acinetobacter sp.]|nr:hypothetical protein [Acinetobacter sp.]